MKKTGDRWTDNKNLFLEVLKVNCTTSHIRWDNFTQGLNFLVLTISVFINLNFSPLKCCFGFINSWNFKLFKLSVSLNSLYLNCGWDQQTYQRSMYTTGLNFSLHTHKNTHTPACSVLGPRQGGRWHVEWRRKDYLLQVTASAWSRGRPPSSPHGLPKETKTIKKPHCMKGPDIQHWLLHLLFLNFQTCSIKVHETDF